MAAIVIAASAFPLRFREVQFTESIFSPPGRANPKGLDYHAGMKAFVVSVTPHTASGRVQVLNTVKLDGTRAAFAPSYKSFRDVESEVAVVPPSGPPVTAGFTPGDIFVGRGEKGEISRLSSTGTVVADVFVNLPTPDSLWGALCFDTHGAFGGRLIATTINGAIFLINANGIPHSPAPYNNLSGKRLEGAAVAPANFGTFAGNLIVGVEGGLSNNADPEAGKVYAVSNVANSAPTLLADLGFTAESIAFVPARGGTYAHAELCFDRQWENRILLASSSQFIARVGRLIVASELTGEFTEVAWNGSQYTQGFVGRAPGRWSSEGAATQGTELETGRFAALDPVLPTWTSFQEIPGSGTTDKPPTGCRDPAQNLQLFVRGIGDRRVYRNGMFGDTEIWTGWTEVPPAGGLLTNHGLACACQDDTVFLFGVADNNKIMFKRVIIGVAFSSETWAELPGGGATNTAASACVSGGKVVVCVKGITSNQLFINEKAPGDRSSWSGWVTVPGGGTTDVSPTVASFQDELYVFCKEIETNRILVKIRTVDEVWTDWAPVPVGGTTNVPVAATRDGVNGQFYMFAKGIGDSLPYAFVVSETGTWASFFSPPNSITASLVGAVNLSTLNAPKNRVYLFAVQSGTNLIHFRRTV